MFEDIIDALVAARVRFVVVGGVAATIQGSARFTNDIDLCYDTSCCPRPSPRGDLPVTWARAKGMTQIARDAGLGRESLYKALSENGNPELATILRVVRALGLRLHAVPVDR